MFRGAPIVWRSSDDIRGLIVEYYTAHKKLPAKADNNWRIVPPQAVRVLEQEALQSAGRRAYNNRRMPKAPFGNDPAKIARYKAFWNRDDVTRPLAVFLRELVSTRRLRRL